MTDWLGSLPSWVSAVAASCALIFTSWTAYNSQRSAKASEKQAQIAVDQQRQRDEKERYEQASKVSAWVVGRESVKGKPVLYVRYVNSSGLPAYVMEVVPNANPSYRYLIPVVEPTSEPRSVEFKALTGWMQSEGRKRAEENHQGNPRWTGLFEAFTNANASIQSMAVEQAGVTVRFRDSNNTVWHRDCNGRLSVEDGEFDPFAFRAELPGATIEQPSGSGVIEIGS